MADNNKRTVGTLIREARKHGMEAPSDPILLEAYRDIPVDPEDVRAEIEAMNPKTPRNTVLKAVDKLVGMHPMDQDELLNLAHDHTNITMATLRQSLDWSCKIKGGPGRKRDSALNDIPAEIARTTLDLFFEKGRLLVHAKDQQFWVFSDTHWEMADPNMLEAKVKDAIQDFKVRYPEERVNSATLISHAISVLRADRACKTEMTRAANNEMSVVNCKNCEVWIDQDTGHIETKTHDPDHYLISCLDIDYDPAAEAPLFNQTLNEIFGTEADCDQLVRHICEMIGYGLQPNKNIAIWWNFIGNGANGKTTLIDVIKALFEGVVCSQDINAFEGNGDAVARENAALVGKLMLIDEDASKGKVLPDGFLKKVTERKLMHANPKWKQPFEFMASISVIIASNAFLKTRDTSKGMRRRARIIPFNRDFEEWGGTNDQNRSKTIIKTELAGVLNMALKGLQRLRARGTFITPPSSQRSFDLWLARANTAMTFISECYTRVTYDINDHNTYESLTNIWLRYQAWCALEGVRAQRTRTNLISVFEGMGYKKTKVRKVLVLKGIKKIEWEGDK